MRITIIVEVPGHNDPSDQIGQDMFDALSLDGEKIREEWADVGAKVTVSCEQTQD